MEETRDANYFATLNMTIDEMLSNDVDAKIKENVRKMLIIMRGKPQF